MDRKEFEEKYKNIVKRGWEDFVDDSADRRDIWREFLMDLDALIAAVPGECTCEELWGVEFKNGIKVCRRCGRRP